MKKRAKRKEAPSVSGKMFGSAFFWVVTKSFWFAPISSANGRKNATYANRQRGGAVPVARVSGWCRFFRRTAWQPVEKAGRYLFGPKISLKM